jgi:hypothetical protein
MRGNQLQSLAARRRLCRCVGERKRNERRITGSGGGEEERKLMFITYFSFSWGGDNFWGVSPRPLHRSTELSSASSLLTAHLRFTEDCQTLFCSLPPAVLTPHRVTPSLSPSLILDRQTQLLSLEFVDQPHGWSRSVCSQFQFQNQSQNQSRRSGPEVLPMDEDE